jgi:hypothetical protein
MGMQIIRTQIMKFGRIEKDHPKSKKITVQIGMGIVARLAWESSLDWHGNRHSIGMGIVTRLAWDSSLEWHGNRRSIGMGIVTQLAWELSFDSKNHSNQKNHSSDK